MFVTFYFYCGKKPVSEDTVTLLKKKKKKVQDSIYRKDTPKCLLFVIFKVSGWTVKEKHFEYKL